MSKKRYLTVVMHPKWVEALREGQRCSWVQLVWMDEYSAWSFEIETDDPPEGVKPLKDDDDEARSGT